MTTANPDLEALAARYVAGETYEQLANDVGVSQPQMRKWLRGRVMSRPKGARPGFPQNSIAPVKTNTELEPAAAIARPSVQRMYR